MTLLDLLQWILCITCTLVLQNICIFITWIELGLLTNENLLMADNIIKGFVVPNNIGRLPHGLKSNYAGFKASQWSTWTMIYSSVVLKKILPD